MITDNAIRAEILTQAVPSVENDDEQQADHSCMQKCCEDVRQFAHGRTFLCEVGTKRPPPSLHGVHFLAALGLDLSSLGSTLVLVKR